MPGHISSEAVALSTVMPVEAPARVIAAPLTTLARAAIFAAPSAVGCAPRQIGSAPYQPSTPKPTEPEGPAYMSHGKRWSCRPPPNAWKLGAASEPKNEARAAPTGPFWATTWQGAFWAVRALIRISPLSDPAGIGC